MITAFDAVGKPWHSMPAGRARSNSGFLATAACARNDRATRPERAAWRGPHYGFCVSVKSCSSAADGSKLRSARFAAAKSCVCFPISRNTTTASSTNSGSGLFIHLRAYASPASGLRPRTRRILSLSIISAATVRRPTTGGGFALQAGRYVGQASSRAYHAWW